jgi:hypothetical protein
MSEKPGPGQGLSQRLDAVQRLFPRQTPTRRGIFALATVASMLTRSESNDNQCNLMVASPCLGCLFISESQARCISDARCRSQKAGEAQTA